MKKYLAVAVILALFSQSSWAQTRVSDAQVSINTNSLGTIVLTTPTLRDLVAWLDANIVYSSNLVSKASTNWVQTYVTNAIVAMATTNYVTNAVTVASATITAYFTPRFSTNNVTAPKDQTPRYIGDAYICTNAITNLIWQAVGMTTNNWKTIYAGIP